MSGITVLRHEQRPAIPRGKAMIVMNDNGWVGTSTGWPMTGQPALYPETQALAIAHALTFMQFLGEDEARNLMPHPEAVPDEVWDWIYKTGSRDHTR